MAFQFFFPASMENLNMWGAKQLVVHPACFLMCVFATPMVGSENSTQGLIDSELQDILVPWNCNGRLQWYPPGCCGSLQNYLPLEIERRYLNGP